MSVGLFAIRVYLVKSPGPVGELTRNEIVLLLLRHGVNKYLIIHYIQYEHPGWLPPSRVFETQTNWLVLRRINPGQDLFAQH